jgi:hypothetical protein
MGAGITWWQGLLRVPMVANVCAFTCWRPGGIPDELRDGYRRERPLPTQPGAFACRKMKMIISDFQKSFSSFSIFRFK